VAAPSPTERRFLLRDLTREVSRSFYLTLRILPSAVRDQIGLAYLLARATDTIADTEAVPIQHRLEALRQLRRRILSTGAGPMPLAELEANQGSESERILLRRINDVLVLLSRQGPEDQALIRQVLETITSGQEMDLARFGSSHEGDITALATAAELDDYTFRVAGCVGDFWTRVCVLHLRPKPRVPEEALVAQGVRFGQGLQLVNILRDIPRDLRQGRCYLPAPELAALGLAPSDLLASRNEPVFRPAYDRWLGRAEEHLQVGWQYVLQLPGSWIRPRLACAWPILIGRQTLAKLRTENVLDPAKRIKISRAEVKRIIRSSILALPFKRAWERLPERFAN
jgi:farnesyl-diphosphate farnesyltransferase